MAIGDYQRNQGSLKTSQTPFSGCLMVFRLPERLFEVFPNGLADAGQFGASAQHAAAVIVRAVEIAACAGEQAVARGGLGVVEAIVWAA